MDNLEKKYRILSSEFEKLNLENEELGKKYIIEKRSNRKLTEENLELEKNTESLLKERDKIVGELRKEINSLKENLNLSEEERTSLVSENTQLQNEIIELKMKLELLKNGNKEIPEEKPKVENVKIEISSFEIENFIPEHWFKLAELTKNNPNINGWLRQFVYGLGKYKRENGVLSEKQIGVIKNRLPELSDSLIKLQKYFEFGNPNEEDGEKDTTENEVVLTFDEILSKGLKEGYILASELSKVNYETDTYVGDYYEAVEELEIRDIKIIY